MKAAVLTKWKNIEIQDIPIPEIDEGECLLKVTYAGVCGSDVHIYEGHNPIAATPLVPGHEFAGVVAKINSSESVDISVGDRVVAQPLISCHKCEACQEGQWHVCRNLKVLGVNMNGGFAEYMRVPIAKVIRVGDALHNKYAALTEPFAVGFHVNQRGGIRNGDSALVIGGGPIGLMTGMVAKISGATQVIFSEINPDRLKFIQTFGFTAINPLQEDPIPRLNALTEGAGIDVVFETSGVQAGVSLAVEACKIRGAIVMVGFPAQKPGFDVTQLILKELMVVGSRVYTLSDFKKTAKMLENIVTNHLFDLDQLISDIRSLDDLEATLHTMKKGENLAKILITCVG